MNGISDRKTLCVLAALLLGMGAGAQAETGAPAIDAAAAFEKLKGLAGSWTGAGPEGEGEAPHEYRLASAGTVVMETMYGGTDHEMINMYHLDGDDLVLTHYCSGGNQPRMKLDRASATAGAGTAASNPRTTSATAANGRPIARRRAAVTGSRAPRRPADASTAAPPSPS